MGRQNGLMIHRESHTGDAAYSVCVFARARVHLKELCWCDSCTETPFPLSGER